jgi:hypothetical protein
LDEDVPNLRVVVRVVVEICTDGVATIARGVFEDAHRGRRAETMTRVTDVSASISAIFRILMTAGAMAGRVYRAVASPGESAYLDAEDEVDAAAEKPSPTRAEGTA